MLDLIVSWLCSGIASAFEDFVNLVMPLFSFNFSTFNSTFPFAAQAYTLFQRVALPIALIIAALGLLPFFTGRMDKATTTPIRALFSAALSVCAIYYGNYILNDILDFCQYPFDAMLGMDGSVSDTNWWSTVFSLSGTVASVFSGLSTLLYLIVLIMLVFNMTKMLLEVIERYVITFVLLYISPLFAAALASETTAGIYKKFITMFISQCLLLFLNLWCMKMALSGLANLATNGVAPIIGMLMTYAFIRISQRMDTYLNQLGLNSVTTGAGLGADIMASGAMMLGRGKSLLGGSSGGGSGSSNKVLGVSRGINQYVRRYDPVSAAARAVADGVKGGVNSSAGTSEAYRSGAANARAKGAGGPRRNVSGLAAAAGHIGHGVAEGFRNSDNMFSRTATGRNIVGNAINATNNEIRTKVGNDPVPSRHTQLMNKIVSGTCKAEEFAAISQNYHLARDGMNYIAETGAIVEEPQEIGAFIRGLSHESSSYKDLSGFVEAGYSDPKNSENISYSMDSLGISASYEADGYKNELSLKSHDQFQKLAATEREGYQEYRVADGHRYHYKVAKHRLDVPQATVPKNSEETGKQENANNDDAKTETTATPEESTASK